MWKPSTCDRARQAAHSHAGFSTLIIAILITFATIGRFNASAPALVSPGVRSAAVQALRSSIASQTQPATPPPTIALVSIFVGGILPYYANYWAESCGSQRSGVDCILVSVAGSTPQVGLARHPQPESIFDCRSPTDPLPSNVIILQIDGSAFRDLFSQTTGLDLHERPEELDLRKVADMKPLYGSLFSQWLSNYTYWGWSDIDLVLGDVLSLSVGMDDDADLHMWYFSGGWEPPLVSGQLSVVRNTEPLRNLWRLHGSALAGIMRDPNYREFDERDFGDVVFGARSNWTAPLIAEGGSAPRPLRVRTVLSGAFSDILGVCNENAQGWRHWWSAGRLWGRRCDAGASVEAAFYHFMCAKWSHAFWRPHGRICDVHGAARWHEPVWNMTFTADPLSISCATCVGTSTPEIIDPRSLTVCVKPPKAPSANKSSTGCTDAEVLARHHRRLFKHISDDAVLTFHDPWWAARSQSTSGCTDNTGSGKSTRGD